MYEEENNLEQNTSLDPDREMKPNNNFTKYILIIVVSLLFIGNAGAFYYIFKNVKEKRIDESIKKVENIIQEENLNNIDNSTTTTEEVALKDGEILIEWSEWPASKTGWDIFNYQKMQDFLKDDEFFKNTDENISNLISSFSVLKVGKIIEGSYTGNDLYIVTFQPEGPIRVQMLRVIKDNDDLIVIGKNSDQLDEFYQKFFIVNNNISIANFGVLETINIPDSSFVLKKTDSEPFKLMTSYDNPEKLFKYNDKDYIYKDKTSNCFIARANDGTVREYSFDLKFLGQKGDSQPAHAIPYKLDITWTNSSKNTNEYIFKAMTGCGASGCYNYVNYISDNDIKEIGKTSTGDSIYGLRDSNFKDILKVMYDQYYPGYNSQTQTQNEKISFEEFLSNRPLIFWKDPFGKFIEFRDAKYLPAVECGKPVIYLYPTKTTNVSVKVAPTGGFTITEPDYNNGWYVRATKDSELYNYSDKTVYPYLFWEGHGMNYERPKTGFVVAKANVEQFLKDKLSQFGLIEKEYNEFIEFWLPKMEEKNYYFITFVPQEQFDKLAPLSIEPKPDTIIRVFMDFEGLDNYVNIAPQTIKNTVRRGFTVVEWGGALHK
ncbi:MAG: hypothetical protein PHZ07_02410 [Patescibacteria group bacterium]|nr:hypothetical protein [Patescibacteria group bacterium]MDD4304252.1 hypothetical protein [Patescibacteria group bacterium]MDD4695306.1 hypothetical protein [Patescibacteria group bacterium]